MGEVSKFVALDGGLRKNTQKKFCAKRAQIKHKKHRRAQAKLLDFFLMIFCERPKNELTIF